MLHIRERWIQFHELVLTPDPPDAPSIKLAEVIPHLQRRIDDGDAFQLKDNERSAYRITDFSQTRQKGHPEALVLLFQYADQDATDPVFADLQTGSLRLEPKLKGEGVAVSAHAVIGLQPIDGKEDTYPFLLEIVPGLGRSSVAPFLKRQIKEATEGQFEYLDEAKLEAKTYRPASELLGTPSKSFVDELERGQLAGLELIKRVKTAEALDEEGYFFEESHVLKVSLSNEARKDDIVQLAVSKLRRWGKNNGYQDLRVRYKKKEGRQKSFVMGTSEADLHDVLVLKDELITADVDLQQCSPEINQAFAAKMISLLYES
ncbi:hypothetical protein CGK74_16885 [Thauera propionica]|uniref:Uncharacterized protein n=1 Tax=Thauera propionica TaxID=2019431 RepID=A0A235EW48_9RHOO|nr:hypothetical protein [Thauera propionica]OYD52645.1 hypothetical protein CGK74_16885 [Thauera propionica]